MFFWAESCSCMMFLLDCCFLPSYLNFALHEAARWSSTGQLRWFHLGAGSSNPAASRVHCRYYRPAGPVALKSEDEWPQAFWRFLSL